MLSIIIPAHNEEGNIRAVVEDFYSNVVAKIEGSELIVVNDASTDATAKILQDLQEELPGLRVLCPDKNLGHGRSIRFGFSQARCEWLFYTDGDFQTRADDLDSMIRDIESYDFQSGIRIKRDDGFERWAVTNVLRIAFRLLTGSGVPDANCPYKAIRRGLWRRIDPLIPENSLAPLACLTYIAVAMNVRSRFLPITWFRREHGVASVAGWMKWVRVGSSVARDILVIHRGVRKLRHSADKLDVVT